VAINFVHLLTTPGKTASDGKGENGLYSGVLISEIASANITIIQLFQKVRKEVSEKSKNEQIPWESTSLTHDYYFRREIEEKSIITETFNEGDSIISPPDLYAQPPYIGSHQFVGRKAELKTLDDWANEADMDTVLLFEAIGGSGKSMLTWEWTKNHADNIRTDWAGKFWYSFYEKGALMTDFCKHALAYITEQPIEEFKGKKMLELSELLLNHLRTKPWLFILDGLERVLVAYHRIDAAMIRDEEVNMPIDKIIDRDPHAAIRPDDDNFIHALASASPSKIIISSRLTPKVLINSSAQTITGVQRLTLAGLRPKDAELLIRFCGVFGDSQEIQNYLSKHCACHPLVIGILAGLIIDYLPDKGNFDNWVTDAELGGGRLNLGKIDIVQKRNHILEIGIANLSSEGKQLLSTLSFLTDIIDYSILQAFNPHLSNVNPNDVSSNAISRLQITVRELEQRGFLQFDGKSYNLHPVVRGVVSGRLQSEELEQYGQKVVDYFSQKANSAYDEAESLDDVSEALKVLTTLLRIGKFQEAFNLYSSGLSAALVFNIEAYNEDLAILKSFFINTRYELPDSLDERDSSYLVHSMAFTLGELGNYDEALKLNYIVLEFNLNNKNWYSVNKNWYSIRDAMTEISVKYSRKCNYRKQEQYLKWAIEIAELINSDEHLFIAHFFYFGYLYQIGMYNEAMVEWEYLDKFKGRIWSRSRYRPGSIEATFCDYQFRIGKLKKVDIEEAEKLCLKGKNRLVLRGIYHLRGIWYINQRKWEKAIIYLSKTIEMARNVGIIDADSEALLALSQFKVGLLKSPAEKAMELSKLSNPSHLSLAELWEAIGNLEQSAKHSLLAYKQYWGDGEPYVDRYYLERTKKLLNRIGVAPPKLPPFNETEEELLPVEIKLIKAIEDLRNKKGVGQIFNLVKKYLNMGYRND